MSGRDTGTAGRRRFAARLSAELRRDLCPVASACAFLLCVHGAGAQAPRPADTVFIMAGSHLDLGFTAPIGEVRQQRIQILDHAIEIAEHNPGFTWFEEGGWSVDAWLDRYRDDPRQIARLRALVRNGRIGVGATLLSPYASAFPEALHLLTLHLNRVERELGRRPTVAVVNDVPAVPEALVDALAAAGIHYLLMGPNLSFSAPLPAELTRDPFYWQSARGARVLVAMDPGGYSTALTAWLLPPACVRFFDPARFPRTISDDSILSLGVGRQLRTGTFPLAIIQHAMDNGEPYCAQDLAAAARRWNQRRTRTTLVAGNPEVYFQHLESRFGMRLRTLHGEWGGDWDLLRASEPVWTWRLRTAIRALNPVSPRELQIAAVMATDHNVGLGPRWLDGVPSTTARQHIAAVAELYRHVVGSALGSAALSSVPAPMTPPARGEWPGTWREVVGERNDAARVRAGPAFIYPFVTENAPTVATPMNVTADQQRLLIHTEIDRNAMERQLGPRYQAVIEVKLRAAIEKVTIAPESSASARAGRWLLGRPSVRIVAPEGVRVTGPGWTFHAYGPLISGWTLVRDPQDAGVTRLQALVLVHAVEGTISGGQKLRLPFADAYPGEPAVPAFDLELRRSPR
jgi:hypothetical protein